MKKKLHQYKILNKLVDYFLETDELSSFNTDKFYIVLGDIEKDEILINRIISDIGKITDKYKIVITQPCMEDNFVNIKIYDIEL